MSSIVFGWNNFKIKSYTPYELGLTNNQNTDFTIEVRQSYFHLFWIPFFGLGKKWAIRKNDQLYELPQVYEHAIEAAKPAVKTPWYTFLGPILLVCTGIGFLAYQEIDDYQSKQYAIKQHEKNTAALTAKLNTLNTRDFITLHASNYADKDVFLKVEDAGKDTLTVTPLEIETKKYRLGEMEIENYYTQNQSHLPSVKLPRKTIMGAYPITYEQTFAPYPALTDVFGNGKKYTVTNVVRHFGPIIEDRRSGGYGPDMLFMEFVNKGWAATVTDIKTLEGNLDWSENINKEIKESTDYETTFSLRTKNYKPGAPYKFLMTLKDREGNSIKYEIAGTNLDKTIRIIE